MGKFPLRITQTAVRLWVRGLSNDEELNLAVKE